MKLDRKQSAAEAEAGGAAVVAATAAGAVVMAAATAVEEAGEAAVVVGAAEIAATAATAGKTLFLGIMGGVFVLNGRRLIPHLTSLVVFLCRFSAAHLQHSTPQSVL
jgi:hypothetical protein